MASSRDTAAAGVSPLARLLSPARYEIIPVRGIEDRVAALPAGVAGDCHGVAAPRLCRARSTCHRRWRRAATRSSRTSRPA